MAKTLTGYPTVIGSKRESLAIHSGPASYVQIATTGDPVTATEFGLKWIESMAPAQSASGTYTVLPIFTNVQVNPYAGGQTSVKLAWFTTAGMTEVAGAVNLSAERVRLTAIGE